MHSDTSVNSSTTTGTSGFDLQAATNWLELLHGSTYEGQVHICSTTDWTGRAFNDIPAAARYAGELDHQGVEGIYVRTTTLQPGYTGRGSVEDSWMLPGFALDIDLAGPGHKTSAKLPVTFEDAQNIVAAAGVPEPTLWVHSGGGVYPWWLFDEPVDIRDSEDRELAQHVVRSLQTLVKAAAEQLGWHFGTGVIDLARVLRLPGSVNRKEGLARPCRIVEPAAYNFHDYNALAGHLLAAVSALIPADAPAEVKRAKPIQVTDDMRPGDAMELAWGWEDILVNHGWRRLRRMGRGWAWQRPGKEGLGLSATTGMAADRDRLFVFTTEAHPLGCSFDVGPITKFGAYTYLEHGGDFKAAGSALRRLGFGGSTQQQQRSDLASLVKPKDAGGASTQVEVVGSEQVQAVEQVVSPLPALVVDHDGLPANLDRVLSQHKWRDRGLVDMYLQAFSPVLRYVATEDEWMIWDGKRWAVDELERAKYASQKLLAAMEDTADRALAEGQEAGKAMVEAAKKICTFAKMNQLPNVARVQPKIAARLTEFDSKLNLVTLDNGIFDLDTKTLMPHNPEMMISKKLNAAYDPTARCERFDNFLAGIMPDKEVRDYVKRCAAATLAGKADERIIMFLYGDSGTGKSAFLEMLVEVFGNYASVADEATFRPDVDAKGPTDRLHKLKGSRLVKMSELAEGATLNQALIKNVTGMDTQSTRPLYGKLVEWKVQYVAWLATNHLPRLSSNDGAVWKRVKPIHFSQSFVDANGEVLNREDRDLGRQLARSSASAILNWLLEGLAEYREGGLQEPAVVGQWLGKYRDETDTTRQFVAEAEQEGQLAVAEGEQVGVRELYRVYTAWCADNQLKPVAHNNFTLRMESNGWVKVKRERGVMWQGIGIRGMIAQAQQPAYRQRK